MTELVFYILAGLTAVFAFLTVTSRNIFHSAVWLSMALLSIAGIYFYLDAPFLAIVQILIYVGAIITLFIFAIMLTAKIGDESIRQTNEQVTVAAVASLALALILAALLSTTFPGKGMEGAAVTLSQLGTSLMTTYLLPFEFLSLLLISALVGAIVIGKGKK